MEGSVAAAGGDAAQGQQAQQAGEAQAQQGPDLAALTGALEQLAGGQQELQQYLQSEPWAAQAAGEQEQQEGELEPAFDPALLDPSDPAYDPAEVQRMISEAARREAQQIVEQQLQPMREEMLEDRRTREAADLVAEFPEMEDPDVQRQVVTLARDMIQANSWPQDLIHDPRFWRVAYMAGRAADAANTEGADALDAAHLEGGGGATPAGSQVDLGDVITGASKGGRSVLPF